MTIEDKLTTIANNVPLVYKAGYDKGKAEGGSNFMDEYQEGGTRTRYAYAFYSWKDEWFKPNYDFTCSRVYAMFNSSTIKEINKKLDFSNLTVDKVTYWSDGQVFRGCSALETIMKIKVSEQNQYTDWFRGCSVLKNITFSGTIGNSISFADSNKLTTGAEGEYMPDGITPSNSVQSIIDHLADLTGNPAQTITFHKDVFITDTQKAKISSLNWSLSQI